MQNSQMTVEVGDTEILTVRGYTRKIKWKSSDEQIVSVNSKGKIKAKKAGNAIIKAKIGKKVVGKYKILVNCAEHEWLTDSVSDATKDSIGYTKYVCSECGIAEERDETYYKPTEEQVYNDITAMQETYPEGTSWTNDNFYSWEAGIFSGGYGCIGFAFLLSDAAFGTLAPATQHTNLEELRVGDILRINNDTHSVVVLAIDDDEITIVEGNFNNSVHWNRVLSKSKLEKDSDLYIITRW